MPSKMEPKAAFYTPIILPAPVPCGICQKVIPVDRIAHGHLWSYKEIDRVQNRGSTTTIYDIFHRTCIQKRFSNGQENCPACLCKVVNAEDYDKKYSSNEATLSFREKAVRLLTLVKKGDLSKLEQNLLAEPPSSSIQYAALWISSTTNDIELTRTLLSATEHGIAPIHLTQLLNLAVIRGYNAIVSLFLDYNDEYSLIHKSKTFTEEDFYTAFRHAMENRCYGIADFFLDINMLFMDDTLENILYLSIQSGYWNGMRFALNYGIGNNPIILKNALQFAAQRGECEMIKDLLNEKSSPLVKREAAIWDAITESYPDAALLLLEGASELELHLRSSAVEEASSRGYDEVLKALTENGPITKEAYLNAQTYAIKNTESSRILDQAWVLNK